LIFHTPHLLPYTDQYGLTVLHHAQISRNAEFYADLLDLLNNPRTFVKKMVWYNDAAALRNDGLCLHREVDADRPDGGLVTVQQVTSGSLSSWADVAAGDRLEGVFTDALQEKRLRKIMEELVSVANGEVVGRAEPSFPLALEFRGPALREILAEGTAALHNAQKQAARARRREQRAAAYTVAPDGTKVVVPRKPGRAPDEVPWPKKKHGEHRHSTVLPTLLVTEQKQKEQALYHPLAPILEARAASGRAAARVAAARRAKSVGCGAVPTKGSQLQTSVSLPALVPSDMAEAEAAKASPKQPSSPTWSRRHWLPENVSLVHPRGPGKLPHLTQVPALVQAPRRMAAVVEAKAATPAPIALRVDTSTEQHSFIF
jgi:hypothetical protein